MAGLPLKEYQRESLDAIGEFCDQVRAGVDRKAMRPLHDAFWYVTRRNEPGYSDVPQLAGTPYVCVRVPTGGGKTLIAAHAVGTIAKRLGHQDRPLCLWVTPTTTIRDQTLNGLRNRDHAYHAALREGLGGGPPEVLTMEEALSANRAMLSSSAVVVVTTIQSYRIDEETGRNVYQDNGYLMDHFANLPDWLRGQLAEPTGDGRVRLTLANVMKLRGPIVIMDEAHKARTRISFDSLERFGPLAVLELTATPEQSHDPENDKYASNALHAVSAIQLKREGMIKLPVELESRDNWLEVLALAVQRRKELADRAAAWGRTSGRFIRPIALIQAQPQHKNRETHTIDKVREALIERLKIPAERIRVVAGQRDELGNEDLLAKVCQVEFIITVEKLREGWDCPFAYVLGSVGNVATETAVEQILGRVLRMPHATPTGVPELDRAYAIVQSEDVARTALSLADSMVNRCGFDRDTVDDVFRIHREYDPQGRLALSSIAVSAAPDESRISPGVQAKVEYKADTGRLEIREALTRDEVQVVRDSFDSPDDRAAVESYWTSEREVGTPPKGLDEYAKPLRIPQLAIRHGQRLLRFEPIELEEYRWELDKCDWKVGDAELSADFHSGDRVELDVTDEGATRIGGVRQVIERQLLLQIQDEQWEKAKLVGWLDRELRRGGQNAGLAASDSQPWLNRVVDYLVNDRGIDLGIVGRKRHELANLLFHRIVEHGAKQVRQAAQTLFDMQGDRRLETTGDMGFEIAEQDYAPYRTHQGTFQLQRHAFDKIGAMDNEEEAACAQKIGSHPNVNRWIRNLSHESAGGFCLPLAPGRFFPDFLAELNDGRTAIIEYKGKNRAELTEEKHKRDVGNLWAERSGGQCVFVWVVERDWATLEDGLKAMD